MGFLATFVLSLAMGEWDVPVANHVLGREGRGGEGGREGRKGERGEGRRRGEET